MVETASTMRLALGAPAPGFDLPDTSGRRFLLADFGGKPALLVAFICPHCPYVKHVRAGFAALAREYAAKGVATVAINSNDPEAFPDDAPAGMDAEAQSVGYDFPYLVDASQAVAKAYGAACTPDFFLFDAKQRLAYRGRMDGGRPGNDVPVTGNELRAALDAVLAGRPAPEEQRPSMGCNIKWRPGNEPDYFG